MKAEELINAIEDHNISILAKLLKNGADPNLGLPHHPTSLPLHIAVEEISEGCSIEAAALLLKYGANPDGNKDERSATPLILATTHKLKDLILMLLCAGANPNFISEEGASPLRIAVEQSYIEIIPILLRFGAIDSINDLRLYSGMTVLGLAVSKLNIPVIKLLLAANANPLILDDYNQTAFEHLPPRDINPIDWDEAMNLLSTAS